MGLYNVDSNINYGRDIQNQNLETKNTILVIPVWIILLILLIHAILIIDKKDIKSPVKFKIEKRKIK